MKNKPADVPYCGVRKDVIEKAKPALDAEVLDLLIEFIQDRYTIHTRKDVEKLPSPWTTNPIFQKGKFTNVRREHDRQTKAYIEIIRDQSTTWSELFWNTVIFRMFNHINPFQGETFNINRLTSDVTRDDYLDEIRHRFERLEKNGVPLFTNAFNTGGLKQSLAVPEQLCAVGEAVCIVDGREYRYKDYRSDFARGALQSSDFEPSMPMRVIRYIASLASQFDLAVEVVRAKRQDTVLRLLEENVRGLSRFLSYQVFVDLTYSDAFPFSENEFTRSGPGCDSGLDLLFSDKGGMTYEECLFWLRDNQKQVFSQIDFNTLMYDLPEYDRCMNVMSLENCFCELQKYERAHRAIQRGEEPRFKVSTKGLVSKPTDETTNSLW